MRGEELKGYLAGLRHAASLVRDEAKGIEARGFAVSKNIADNVRAAAYKVDAVAYKIEREKGLSVLNPDAPPWRDRVF